MLAAASIAARCASTSTAGSTRRRPRGTESTAAASPPPANRRNCLRPGRFTPPALASALAAVAVLSNQRSVATPAIPAATCGGPCLRG